MKNCQRSDFKFNDFNRSSYADSTSSLDDAQLSSYFARSNLLKASSINSKQLHLRTLSSSSIKQSIKPTYKKATFSRENSKRFHCEFCNREFKLKSSLVEHQDSERCSKKFSLKRNEHRLEEDALAQRMMSDQSHSLFPFCSLEYSLSWKFDSD